MQQSKLLWIIDVERFPMIDCKPKQHAKVRLAQTILTNAIPETRDIINTVYIRKVEKVGGQLRNVEIEKFENV